MDKSREEDSGADKVGGFESWKGGMMRWVDVFWGSQAATCDGGAARLRC